MRSIKDERFESPSEIQEKSIPLIIAGKDVIAGSATGSGKTLAFAAGILKNAEKGRGIQALVLTPTRELAEQVAQALSKFSRYKPLEIIAVYGGVGINPQIRGLKTADVVVGTPGRLLDHIARNTLRLGRVRTLVLDEADRMFDMGFKDDVEKIIRKCPQERQTLLFSATINKEVVQLSRRYMHEPLQVSVDSFVDPKKLVQTYYDVADDQKFSLLLHLLKNENSDLVMVFCNTKRNTDKVTKNLRFSGIDALAIHGGLTQYKRNDVMQQFHTGKFCVLVCTDVAARGLDIHGVSHVYNYDIPRESKQYIHRIGRTARAGAEGKAINILSRTDYDNFGRVLKENDVEITEEPLPAFAKAAIRQPERRTNKPISRKPHQRDRNRRRL
ncbi:MAG: DEAD/DEAH box helicase [Candidatus Methanoperedens sp.]|uniref:DEAD/DEAH box helicase n=1 Tax=Candidatus Methanoperedens sp. BLZ2 TaxID=2035255 RepID=UPI000BE471D9|nr:DEAD/DEAH box helicase [Candidatus Methanoperedens sp. BLZ2]KAB2947262.1 MAG: DEAD/DEAH box helicase [Candidatus Methanoperedens sp.]MBZ0175406.1 DEAD/DEAH box helicase [Candidatus Methanoperedens nitroreducens]MCX9079668.1 DEAD/DEAH box helicase [Candidatus Methanoperedens sp.]